MPRDIETIAFAGSQERAAFESLIRDKPDLWGWFEMGEGSARRFIVPRIRNCVLGGGLSTVDECIQGFLDSGLKGLRQGRPDEQADEDQCFAYRLGFMSVTMPVRDAKFGIASPIMPTAPAPRPAHRLRAADFGTLPMPSRERH